MALKVQLYGREQTLVATHPSKEKSQATYNNSGFLFKPPSPTQTFEAITLGSDLLKISGLAAVLVGAEVLLYLLSSHANLKF